MVSGVDSSRPIGSPQRAPEDRRHDERQRRDAGRFAEQQRLDDLADDEVAADDPAQHQERLQPARHDREGDQGGQHCAQHRADIGNEAQRAGQQSPQHRVGHAEREQAAADQRRRSRNWSASAATGRGRRGAAASPMASDVACTSLAPNSRTNWSLRWSRSSRMKTTRIDDDADGQQRMQQGRHEGGHARETRDAALHAHRRRRRRAGRPGRGRWPSEATMDTKRLSAPPPSDRPRMSWIFW